MLGFKDMDTFYFPNYGIDFQVLIHVDFRRTIGCNKEYLENEGNKKTGHF